MKVLLFTNYFSTHRRIWYKNITRRNLLKTKLCALLNKLVTVLLCQIYNSYNPSIYNIIRWFAGWWDKRLVDHESDAPSIIIFLKFLQNSLQRHFQFIFFVFYKITKMKIKSLECPKFTWNYEEKILRMSDAWFVPSA